MTRQVWQAVAAATLLMGLVLGSRSAFGLFVSPLNSATGIGLAGLGFAIAVGQLAQGVAQPVLGALADRYGTQRLIRYGSLLLALTTLAVTMADSLPAMAGAMVVLAVAGSAVGSSNLLIAEVGRRVPLERRAMAFGVVSAGGSAGQMLFGPGTQVLIESKGWVVALVATALIGLLAWPLARFLGNATSTSSTPEPVSVASEGDALRTSAFWLIAGSYAVCGFHIGYLTTHMPGVIERCGLPASLAGIWLAVLGLANIAGSLSVAWWLRAQSVARRADGHICAARSVYRLADRTASKPSAVARLCSADGPELHGLAAGHLAAGRRALRDRTHGDAVRSRRAGASGRQLRRRLAGRSGRGGHRSRHAAVVHRHRPRTDGNRTAVAAGMGAGNPRAAAASCGLSQVPGPRRMP